MPHTQDIILVGASGFTGRLVAEYLLRTQGLPGGPAGNQAVPRAGGLRWAVAGRNAAKLQALADDLGVGGRLPLITADVTQAEQATKLAAQARVVITTTGPYQRLGEPLVQACADAGTDYVDLCGEPAWMARMIPRLQAPARASGARIVFSCGFDSIPFDLGVVFLQHHAQQRFGMALPRVRGRVQRMQGGFSGGTAASLLATMEQVGRDPAQAAAMADPFALTPGFRGPPQPDAGDRAEYDEVAKSWTAPFVMAPINTKNVHRTNALRGHPWGEDFAYDERMLTGAGMLGEQRAKLMARQSRWQQRALGFGPARALIGRLVLPQPGQGPNAAQREAGHYEVHLLGTHPQGQRLRAIVKGDRDPGYGSTSKMVSEAALCLLWDVDRHQAPGGVWTPGAAMGLALVRRLAAHAGLGFAIDDGP